MAEGRNLDDVGKRVQLVSWTRGRNDWTPHYAAGQVLANTATTWTLNENGTTAVYDKTTWALYRT